MFDVTRMMYCCIYKGIHEMSVYLVNERKIGYFTHSIMCDTVLKECKKKNITLIKDTHISVGKCYNGKDLITYRYIVSNCIKKVYKYTSQDKKELCGVDLELYNVQLLNINLATEYKKFMKKNAHLLKYLVSTI
jgi:hypothetical protein